MGDSSGSPEKVRDGALDLAIPAPFL